jgi:serine/threonine protein kinase
MRLRAEGASHTRIVQVGETIGKGGEGRIARIQASDGLAVKLFAKEAEGRRRKIERMVQLAPTHAEPDKARSAWPAEPLFDGDHSAFVGFTMPLFPCHTDSTNSDEDYSPLSNFLGKGRIDLGLRGDFKTDFRFRLIIAQNLARLVAEVHAAGHAIIDLKPPNILVHKETGGVVLVDCDSCLIDDRESGHVFPATVVTPEFLAPECQKEMSAGTQSQDRFALGMILFKLLNNDQSPTQGRPKESDAQQGGLVSTTQIPSGTAERIEQGILTTNPASPLKPGKRSVQNLLPDATVELFTLAFGKAKMLRPSAKSWMEHLAELETAIRPCADNPNYVDLGKGCLGTALERAGAERLAADGTSESVSETRNSGSSGSPTRHKQARPTATATTKTSERKPKVRQEPVRKPTPKAERPVVPAGSGAAKTPAKEKAGTQIAEVRPAAPFALVLRALSGGVVAVLGSLTILVHGVVLLYAASDFGTERGIYAGIDEGLRAVAIGLLVAGISVLTLIGNAIGVFFFERAFLATFPAEKGQSRTSPLFNIACGVALLVTLATVAPQILSPIWTMFDQWHREILSGALEPEPVAVFGALALAAAALMTLAVRMIASLWSRSARDRLRRTVPLLR